MKPILKHQTHLKISSCPNTLVKVLLTPVMEIDSGGNGIILFHILIPIPLLPYESGNNREIVPVRIMRVVT